MYSAKPPFTFTIKCLAADAGEIEQILDADGGQGVVLAKLKKTISEYFFHVERHCHASFVRLVVGRFALSILSVICVIGSNRKKTAWDPKILGGR